MLRTEHLSTTTADPDRVHDLRPRTSGHTGEEAHPAWAADLPTPASKIWAAFRLQRADFAPAVVCWPPASPVPPPGPPGAAGGAGLPPPGCGAGPGRPHFSSILGMWGDFSGGTPHRKPFSATSICAGSYMGAFQSHWRVTSLKKSPTSDGWPGTPKLKHTSHSGESFFKNV